MGDSTTFEPWRLILNKQKEGINMKYYGYRRVSTPTQEKSGYGLETQKNEIERYCHSNNIELSGFFEDAGISGTTADRDGLNELLSVLDKDDCVIVLNTSRLWRSDSVKVLIHHEFKKDNVKIISIEQPNYDIYTKDPNDFLFNGMMELLDQYERMTISKKLAKGRKTKARNGSKSCGAAPYGYRWENAEIVIDYNNHLIVRDIFNMYAECNNLSEVARRCIAKEYKTAQGNDFSKKSISNILHNDFYIGIVTHAGKKTPGTHEPIIERELFEQING